MIKTITQDSILSCGLFYLCLIVNFIQIISLPLGLGWTCQLLPVFPLFYVCDLLNGAVLIASMLVQYRDEFGTLQDSPKETFKMMIKKGGALQIAFWLPWDIIPLVAASSGACYPYDYNYRIWIYLRAIKIIPALASLLKSVVQSAIPYVSVQVGRLVKSIIGLLILVHLSACFFFSLSGSQQLDNSWVNQVIIKDGGATEMIDQYSL